MITRGELQSINFNENTCTVRVPLFETAGTKDPIILPALFAIQPGACNGYLVGDKVWVAFEGGESLSHVVVIGKMYIDIGTEKEIAGGGITCADLTVKNSAVIPVNTKISFDSENPIKNAAVSLTSYNSLSNVIKNVSDNCARINALEDSINSGYLVSANSTGEVVGPLNTINIGGKIYSISGGGGSVLPAYTTANIGQVLQVQESSTGSYFAVLRWANVGGSATNAVRYDISQSLSSTQQLQARTNIGAGTSNLTLGNTSTTAAAGNHTHIIQTDWNITDSTATGYIKNKPAIPNITSSDISNWNNKQDQLISGTNIKTINNQTLLGSGNITISGDGGVTETTGTGKIKLTGLSTDFGSLKWSLIGKQLIVYFYDVDLTSSPFYNTNSIFITGLPEVTFSAHNFWAYLNLDNTIWGKLIFTKTTTAGNATIVFSPSSSSTILTSQTLKDLNNSILTILTD